MRPAHKLIEPVREQMAQDMAYNAALNDCIALLRKWFWGTNKDARACEAEMRNLAKMKGRNHER